MAGGEPFGGSRAMEPLAKEFPNLVTKETLAHKGELLPYTNRSTALAAIDYIVSLSSDVFLPSHGGNMAKAMQVNRLIRVPYVDSRLNHAITSFDLFRETELM